jgi:predicted amidophosphoribosyltransferase
MKSLEMRALTCPKCGAPMKSWHECAYCGTNFVTTLENRSVTVGDYESTCAYVMDYYR